ncbi:hypothetical protein VIGAN_08149400 [Vigna angularis var. angularis]|uniref:Uncharacterized protein n=1 Tax=Vigna angularis var. angularis TaxID=157739 RepID=A0A0S3SPV3_PHAAN|nr:hypothetical protein VIGAN_08149400 [Vigna angularis var. angularis]
MFMHANCLYIRHNGNSQLMNIMLINPSPSAVISSDFKSQLSPKCICLLNFASCFFVKENDNKRKGQLPLLN